MAITAVAPNANPRRSPRRAALPIYAMCVLYLSVLVAVFVLPHMIHISKFTGMRFGTGAFTVLALAFSIRAATRPALDRTRRAWRLVAATFFVLTAFPLAAFVVGVGDDATEVLDEPTVLDAFRILVMVLLGVALWAFPRQAGTQRVRYKFALDMITVLGAGCTLLWQVIVVPVLGSHHLSPLAVGFALAYPAGELVLIFGGTAVLLNGAEASARRPVSILLAGSGMLVISDIYSGFLRSQPGDTPVTDWQLACTVTGVFLFAVAAAEQCRIAARVDQPAVGTPSPLHPASRLPYLALGVGYAVLLTVAYREHSYPWVGLVLGAVVMTSGVAVRQVIGNRENRDMVVTDGLTGLANRLRLNEDLTRTIERGQRTGQPAAVLLIDIDGFKQVNDTLGHQTGDNLLATFAALLKGSVLGSDTVARLGGDEFAIVLGGAGSTKGAEAVAARILMALDRPLSVSGMTVQPSASIGIAVTDPTIALTAGELLHHADMAMHQAKSRKGNSWQVYADGMAEREAQAAAFERDLRGAVLAGELRVQYQPIVSLDNGALAGMEALVRWEHPTRGMLPPGEFIPLAEETGVITEIGIWVLEEACRQVGAWQAQLPTGHRIYVSVNLSPRQLERDSLAEEVLDIVRGTGFPPSDLVLEVTESAMVDDQSAAPQLRTLQAEGIRIALDDFGTGYSSLRHLTRLPVDILKLDRSFVNELNGTPEGSAVAQAVVRLSQILNLDTVAEGIEVPGQATELTLLGCRNGQGYHYARPMDPEAVQRLVNTATDGNWPCLPASLTATSAHGPVRELGR